MIKDDIDTILNLPTSSITNNTFTDTNSNTAMVATEQLEELPPTDFDVDFETARANIQELIASGHTIFELANQYAQQSESARAFEVATGLLKTLSSVNLELLDLHEKKKKITGGGDDAAQKITVEKAVFIGSTADIQKQLGEK